MEREPAKMFDLRLIDATLRWITAALWSVVLIQWFRWQNLFVAPWFAGYLLFSLVQIVWRPHTVKPNLFIEPALLSLRFCSVIEAVRLCFATSREKERRWLIWLMLYIGALAMVILWGLGYRDVSGLSVAYASIRQYFHVALALACVMGAVCFAEAGVHVDRIPRNHFLILAAHLVFLAVLGFFRPATGLQWREIHIWYFASVCGCLACWLRLGPLFRL